METITVENPTLYDKAVEDASKKYKVVFVLITGEVDKATGESWCPSCRVAAPILKKLLPTVPDSVLLYCPVVKSEYRGNPSYPYRKKPGVDGGVPTLHWINAPSPMPPLGQCAQEDYVAMWLEMVKEQL
ncbi:hypothetical protein ADUPG1_009472 [Aduncisulcus paluster]|uniref:Thioredoxin domain-containing protein n=1 Tax=Aduncisulcus paluster TaxID=2918883 RepID=A0ABQ5KYJ1_9EUKA|nr:hypothetical protein ADUPG1_009472 [Aduncisulcus paluster]